MTTVRGTGVAIRAASGDEVLAMAAARRGADYDLGPGRSYEVALPEPGPGPQDVLVVSEAFVDLDEGG